MYSTQLTEAGVMKGKLFRSRRAEILEQLAKKGITFSNQEMMRKGKEHLACLTQVQPEQQEAQEKKPGVFEKPKGKCK